MAEKELKARIVHKHDTEANWNKAIIEITIIMMMILIQSSENKEKKFVHYVMTKTLY